MLQLDPPTELDEAASLFSDMYKDVTGIRPRMDTESWTLDDFNKKINQLGIELKAKMAEDKVDQEKAIQEFEARIEETLEMGAKDRATAIRWICEAENAAHSGELCYLLNLPTDYFTKNDNPA
jgi:hypothetical protein